MGNKHDRAFFGSKTTIIISSSSKEDDRIWIRCIKKKTNDDWESPKEGEGKNISIDIYELIQINKLLSRVSDNWSTVHKYQDIETKISFKWDDKEQIWVNIGNYAKKLNIPEIDYLKLLFDHLITEKIENNAKRPQKEG